MENGFGVMMIDIGKFCFTRDNSFRIMTQLRDEILYSMCESTWRKRERRGKMCGQRTKERKRMGERGEGTMCFGQTGKSFCLWE